MEHISDAVDLHGCIEQDEGQEHIDGKDDKNGEEGHIPTFVFDSAFHNSPTSSNVR